MVKDSWQVLIGEDNMETPLSRSIWSSLFSFPRLSNDLDSLLSLGNKESFCLLQNWLKCQAWFIKIFKDMPGSHSLAFVCDTGIRIFQGRDSVCVCSRHHAHIYIHWPWCCRAGLDLRDWAWKGMEISPGSPCVGPGMGIRNVSLPSPC